MMDHFCVSWFSKTWWMLVNFIAILPATAAVSPDVRTSKLQKEVDSTPSMASNGVFTSNSALETAVNQYCDNPTSTASHGDIDGWDVSRVANFGSILKDKSTCNPDIGNWDMSQATDFSNMFNGATTFNSDIGDWDTSQVTTFYDMFIGLQKEVDSTPSMASNGVFTSNSALKTAVGEYCSNPTSTPSHGDIAGWDVSGVANFKSILKDKSTCNPNIGNWDMSQATLIDIMFQGAAAFNSDIGGWDMSQVTKLNNMFQGAAAFNQDISNWDTSKVPDFSEMFSGAAAFDQDIGGWDTSQAANFYDMFKGATAFNSDIGGWDTSKG
eukprot:CAMPEP_0183378164 /NCGR_PEP_ID=MMETSP0164_2-20130417/124772_1 /TAXON_ID=221442 /ORGANISM="Coccolithus pelagicus ssp braarudi, Strain PLY182g" /LENGTH=324 /DNA_ID=CAMNT_0025555711 /DNA_START=163 /DNA_END=1133 /DNA_ORIENTATION=+